ncbi:bifunctional protein GlmU [Alphaproteobacteria bacterium]|nr:bifunctional protein GlmU [Alphaproteobacteria bacterium]GHS98643.1 bifunctional protein GlmU [Alphaproteobacteria bacterium]
MAVVIILAGGRGKRMKAPLPKVLMPLAGQSLLESVVRSAHKIKPKQIVLVGSHDVFAHPLWQDLQKQWVQTVPECSSCLQNNPGGTGHAVQTAFSYIRPFLEADEQKIVLCHGDMPLIQAETLQALAESPADFTVSGVRLKNPEASTFGRIEVNSAGAPIRIFETRDATEEQKKVSLANAAFYAVSRACLEACLFELTSQNAAQELYFTDLLVLAVQKGFSTCLLEVDADEATGFDTLEDLQTFPVQTFLRKKMMQRGVLFQDPASVMLSIDTEIGAGTTVAPFNVLGPSVQLGAKVTLEPFCVLDHCVIKDGCVVGPFAHIKAQSCVESQAVIGNFVEIKKSNVGEKTKVKHLSYIGDASLGPRVNVGAGTVVCNYDGIHKHPTVIESGVQVGANSTLVAPLTIAEAAFVGAGSVITENVPTETLALGRARQVHKLEWVRKRREKIRTKKEME